MAETSSAIKQFISSYNCEPTHEKTIQEAVEDIFCSSQFKHFLDAILTTKAFSEELGKEFAQAGAIQGLPSCRKLRACLNQSLSSFFGLLAELLNSFDASAGQEWYKLSNRIHGTDLGKVKLMDHLVACGESKYYDELCNGLIETAPHSVYPTSCFRESKGYVVSTPDDLNVEAVMSCSTFTSIRVIENSLDPQQTLLRDVYISSGRCVCLIDHNVENHFGDKIEAYFNHHGIHLEKLVYRAMEVDKGIHTVEKMLGDFKRLGVSRVEPVLIAGGGVLADTGGLACALYHRSTPYVMLSTSIVSGIDAGPSPRTCCDGFGYKNLFGAYHAPILSITDRSFFKTLREGWLRHGIAEIIKMACVKDIELFNLLEQAGARLITTRFGTLDTDQEDEICALSQKILGAAMRSYVEAEYDNLYETHQCRPHAFGHTWSPGFEIEAGLLHGHAVAIGMGFGAYLSHKEGWISEKDMSRILNLITSFGLSLWHDVLLNNKTVWAAQEKMVQKRGGNLAAPVPKGEIGKCGYINTMEQDQLYLAIQEYQTICAEYPQKGLGIEAHCRDVGLEDPSTVGNHISADYMQSS